MTIKNSVITADATRTQSNSFESNFNIFAELALDKYKNALPKLDNGISMVPSGLNGLTSVHRALLQQQQLLAQQQQQQQQMSKTQQRSEGEKMVPELPAVVSQKNTELQF